MEGQSCRPPVPQVGAFGAPGRVPRRWVIDVVYAGLAPAELRQAARAGDDAGLLAWHDLALVPTPLAVDHQPILCRAFRRVPSIAWRGGRTRRSCFGLGNERAAVLSRVGFKHSSHRQLELEAASRTKAPQSLQAAGSRGGGAKV